MSFLRRRMSFLRRSIVGFIVARKTALLVVGLTTTVVPLGFYKYRHFQMRRSIDSTLLNGSKYPVKKPPVCVKRDEILQRIKSRFIHKDSVNSFGVICGPLGSGKTSSVTEIACRGTPGIVYAHVSCLGHWPKHWVCNLHHRLFSITSLSVLLEVLMPHTINGLLIVQKNEESKKI